LGASAACRPHQAAVVRLRRRTCAGRGGGVVRCAEAASETAIEEVPPYEEPTPFPADPLFKLPEFEMAIKLMPKSDDEELDDDRRQELFYALEYILDVHNSDRQWIKWPDRMQMSRKSPMFLSCFKFLRGLRILCLEDDDELRELAMEVTFCFSCGGYFLSRVPPAMLVECGFVETLVQLGEETYDRYTFQVLVEIMTKGSREYVTKVIRAGAIEVALSLLDSQEALPLQQLAALDLLVTLCKRAPIKVAEAGCYDAVKIVRNPALIPRRNSIMNMLRPLVKPKGDDGPVLMTNLGIGGVKR